MSEPKRYAPTDYGAMVPAPDGSPLDTGWIHAREFYKERQAREQAEQAAQTWQRHAADLQEEVNALKDALAADSRTKEQKHPEWEYYKSLQAEHQAREEVDKRLTNLHKAAYEHLRWNDPYTHQALQEALAACEEKYESLQPK